MINVKGGHLIEMICSFLGRLYVDFYSDQTMFRVSECQYYANIDKVNNLITIWSKYSYECAAYLQTDLIKGVVHP